MKRLRYATCVLMALAALGTPAFAVDGVTLINQATVQAAGGFPYTISQPGSYRLSGSLVAASTGAINITASNVTLDLNGFTIGCVACSGVAGISSNGIAVAIMNGTVDGFQGSGGTGIYFQGPAAKVDHMTVNGNTYGVATTAGDPTTGEDLTVTESNISSNSMVGVSGQFSNVTVRNSVVSGNGLAGIYVRGGLVAGSLITSNGLNLTISNGFRSGITAYGGILTVTNNTIANNVGWGILAGGGTPIVGYGSNTIAGNLTDVSQGAGLYSMHNNVCSSGGC